MQLFDVATMVGALQTFRKLEQRYCRGIAEELEHYKRELEELRAKVMSVAERSR